MFTQGFGFVFQHHRIAREHQPQEYHMITYLTAIISHSTAVKDRIRQTVSSALPATFSALFVPTHELQPCTSVNPALHSTLQEQLPDRNSPCIHDPF